MLKKFNRVLIAVALCLTILPATLLTNSQTAEAYQAPKTHVWKNNIVANINTDGSITVSEQKIIDITKYVDLAREYKPTQAENTTSTASTNSTSDTSNNNDSSNSTSKTKNYLEPVIWSFNSLPEIANIKVAETSVAICGDGDIPLGSWDQLSSSTFMAKWNIDEGPTKQCYAYNEADKQVFCYIDLLNSKSFTSKQAYEKLCAMTGITDAQNWKFNKAIINTSYTIEGAPLIYKDVADFNWAYVSDTWVSDTYDVDLTITIPVGTQTVASPTGETRNIYAWGHGSSNGVVSFDESGLVKISNDKVPGGTDAEVRVVFPSAWLDNLHGNCDTSYTNQTKLSTILKEESVWRDGRTDLVNSYFLAIIYVPICIAFVLFALIVALVTRKKYGTKKTNKAEFLSMHPCIQVRLKNWNRPMPHDMVASILHLNEIGFLKITKLHSGDFRITATDPAALKDILAIPVARDKEERHKPKETPDSTVSVAENIQDNASPATKLDIINKVAKAGVERIDILTLHFLFSRCGFGKPFIDLQEILTFANARSKNYWEGYTAWNADLTQDVNRVCEFKYIHTHVRKVFYGMAVLLWLVSTIIALIYTNFWVFVSGMIAGCAMVIIANSMRNKIIFEDESGKPVESTQIELKFGNYTDTIDQFKDGCMNLLENLESSVQEKLHYLP